MRGTTLLQADMRFAIVILLLAVAACDAYTPAAYEPEYVVEAYLEAAREKGFREVRVIHGRGKGFQRIRVQQLLANHPLVASFESAPPSRGGMGATLVWLKPLASKKSP